VSHIWVSHITDEMLRMELTACRTLSTCLRVYDFCCYVHLDMALFDYPEGLRCGSYQRPSALVSVVSMITIVTHLIHLSSSDRSAPIMHPPQE
jgi:hypothetical protein